MNGIVFFSPRNTLFLNKHDVSTVQGVTLPLEGSAKALS